jgi:hypothetical protein
MAGFSCLITVFPFPLALIGSDPCKDNAIQEYRQTKLKKDMLRFRDRQTSFIPKHEKNGSDKQE